VEDTTSSIELLYQDERPILAVEIIRIGTRYILIIGTTSGEVVLFDLPSDASSTDWTDISNTAPILRYQAHSMGTNTISARLIEDSEQRLLRICTGGDDQAICCSDVDVLFCGVCKLKQAAITATSRAPDAAISALKGVKFIADHYLVATGYDQRMSVWRVADGEIIFVTDTAVDIGDINCLAHVYVGSGKHLLAAGGAGVELLSMVTDVDT